MSMNEHNRFLEPENGGSRLIGGILRQLLVWLVGGIVVYMLVASRSLLLPNLAQQAPQMKPVAAALPLRHEEIASNSLILHAARDGYVYVDVEVNGIQTRMAFDTGASFVSLTQDDARRAGIGSGLNYSLEFTTANGKARGAPVTLREVRIGGLDIYDVQAVVMQNLSISLLGQSFLNRLDSYQMRDGVMTLTWQ